MSNINKEFEDYWKNNTNMSSLIPTNITKDIKEFCRNMYVDIVVKERQRK